MDSLEHDLSPISELMNLAWCQHEITDDYLDEVLFLFFHTFLRINIPTARFIRPLIGLSDILDPARGAGLLINLFERSHCYCDVKRPLSTTLIIVCQFSTTFTV